MILAVIVAAAAAARLHRLGEGSMWFDERASVMSATGHFGDWIGLPRNKVIEAPDLVSPRYQASLLNVLRTPDFHPPLYAVLLRFWRELTGEGDASTRMLSVLASLTALVCLFDLARVLVNTPAALWACAIMALAQPQIQYAQEARDYALWQALCVGAFAAAARLIVLGPGWRRAIALNCCVLGMLLTHFLAIGCIGALICWCAFYLRGPALRKTAIAAAGSLVVLSVVGGPLILQAYQNHGDASWLGEPAVGHARTTFLRAALLPARFLADPVLGAQTPAMAGAVIYLLPLLFLRRGLAGAAGNPVMLLCFLWLMSGVGLVLGLDLAKGTQGLGYMRFTLVASPAVYLLIAALPLRPALRHAAPMAAVIACLLALPYDYEPVWKGQWRELGGDVRRLARRGDLVVFAAPGDYFLANPIQLYEGVEYYAHPIPCPVVILDKPADAQVMEQVHHAAHVWLVTPQGPAYSSVFLPGCELIWIAPMRRFAAEVWQASCTIPP